MVLEEWAQRTHLEAVRTALAKEKNKKIAAQLQALAEDLEKAGTEETRSERQSYKAEKQLAAELYKGNRKRKVEWVQDLQLPAVHFQKPQPSDSGSADEQERTTSEYMFVILVAYADMEILGID